MYSVFSIDEATLHLAILHVLSILSNLQFISWRKEALNNLVGG